MVYSMVSNYEILLVLVVLTKINNLIHLSVKRLTLLFSLVYSLIQVDRNRKQKDSAFTIHAV